MTTNKTIDHKDISVIVQGSIARSPSDTPEDRHTEICLASIRKALPGATIILATWKGTNVEGLDYDVLVESDDPGSVPMGCLSPSGKQAIGSANGFRQIAGSRDGLKAANTKYSLRIRNDLVLKHDDFLDYFTRYSGLPYDTNYKILGKRIVVLSASNPHRRSKLPFTVADWFFFGLTEDLINVFDVPLIKKETAILGDDGEYHKTYGLLSAEQYLWSSFISKYRAISFEHTADISHDNIAISEKYFANNCIFITAQQAGVYCLKYPGAAYGQRPAFSNSGLYTFTDYKKLLNRYANNHLLVIPNPFEEAAYFLVYHSRFFIQDRFPRLHDVIRRMVNPAMHKKLDATPGSRDANYKS